MVTITEIKNSMELLEMSANGLTIGDKYIRYLLDERALFIMAMRSEGLDEEAYNSLSKETRNEIEK